MERSRGDGAGQQYRSNIFANGAAVREVGPNSSLRDQSGSYNQRT